MRRLEDQALPLLGERCRQFAQARSGTRGHHQFGRLVGDDPAVGGDIEPLAGLRTTVETLAAAATNRQLAARAGRSGNACAPVVDQCFHQNLGAVGARATRAWVYSRQRASVGTPLPGLSSPCSSKAALRR
jgi:hypothetical protein